MSHLLLAESTDDVRHPPMADDDDGGDEAGEAEAEAEGGAGLSRRRSSTQVGKLSPKLTAPTRLLRQNTSKLARRHSSTCATLSVRRKAGSKPLDPDADAPKTKEWVGGSGRVLADEVEGLLGRFEVRHAN